MFYEWLNGKCQKKRLVALVAVLLMATTGWTAPYYVATDGKDLNPGTEAEPFATIQKARDQISSDMQDGDPNDMTVYIRGGKYYLSEPLTFDDTDSAKPGHEITYKNYPGETPVIYGGKPVTGWQLDSGSIYKAYVGAHWKFYCLIENDHRCTMARKPNSGYYTIGTKVSRSQFIYRSKDYSTFNYSDAQAILWPGNGDWNWFSFTDPVSSVNFTTRTVTLQNEAGYDLRAGHRYFLQGAKEFLNQPGEFYLDESTGWLYYWPVNTPIAAQEIIPPTTKRVLDIRGLHFLRNGR